MSTIAVTAAGTELTQLVDAVGRGDEVTLARDGKPVAALVRPRGGHHPEDPKFTEMHAGVAESEQLFDEARRRPFGAGPGLAPGRADELVAEIRADRDAR